MKVIATERIPIKLWLNDIEDGALQQARDLANLKFAYKWIAIMPDSHQGYGMPIGGVMATDGIIVPNAVGVDIGCGMKACRFFIGHQYGIEIDTLKKIMGKIRKVIPVGFDHQKEFQQWDGFTDAPDIQIIQNQITSARKQLGTLGGGNHFIEIQKDDNGYIWVMIHSGSRNLGFKTANYYHKIAKKICERWMSDIPNPDLSFLPIEISEGKEYFEAMKYCLEFARANRELMMNRVYYIFQEMFMDSFLKESIDIHHNYAAFENHYGKNVLVHRKGAVKAIKDNLGIIPGSMGSNSYIIEGLSNPESFNSCSHGAGRKMARNQAKRELNLIEEQEKMKGIVHGLRSTNDLDEAPGSYKDIDEVMENQKDLVKIKVKLTPLASIKG